MDLDSIFYGPLDAITDFASDHWGLGRARRREVLKRAERLWRDGQLQTGQTQAQGALLTVSPAPNSTYVLDVRDKGYPGHAGRVVEYRATYTVKNGKLKWQRAPRRVRR